MPYHALFTAGTLGPANLPTVVDEGLVEGIHLSRFDSFLQQVVGFVGRYPGSNKGQSLGDPVDVGIDGHSRHTQGEAEDDPCGFGAYSRQLP